MNKAIAVAEFVEWDVRNWSSALDFWLAHTRQDVSNSHALELGSRRGGLSLWLALQGARVLCSDVGPPSEIALQRHLAHGLSSPSIEYESIDATNIPYANKFDIVVFKSLLGAIGRVGGKELQKTAVREMHKALKEGGELFFAENLAASWLHQSLRRRFVRWGTRWRYVSVPEMQEFLAPFSQVHYRALGFAGVFGRGEKQRNLFALLDQAILNRIAPENWRYLIIGVAVK